MVDPEPHAATLQTKLLGSLAVKLRVALVSALILITGALLAPRAARSALSVPQEHAAPLLEEQQQQLKAVVAAFRGVHEAASRVIRSGVAIAPDDLPTVATLNDFSKPIATEKSAAGFGVFIAESFVLTHALALGGRSTVQVLTPEGERLAGTVAAYEPSTGLTLVETAPSGMPAARLATADPAAGALAMAAGHWAGRPVAAPIFVTTLGADGFRVEGGEHSMLAGMPLYNLDGELFGIAAGQDRQGLAYPVREAVGRLMLRAANGERLAACGLTFQALAGLLTRAFGEGGVLIADVVEAGPADAAGLQAGDVLLAIGDTDVTSPDAAARVLAEATVGTATTLLVRRGDDTSSVNVSPMPAYEVAVLANSASQRRPTSMQARELLSAAVLQQAQIPSTARVVSLNGRVISSRAQANRELRRARRPIPVLLQHDEQTFFVAIEPVS